MTARSVVARAIRGGLIGVIAGVAWLALVLELNALGSFSADANPATAWILGAFIGLFLVAPITGIAGILCGLITVGIDGRRALRACAIGAMIAVVLTLAWVGARREERWGLIGQHVWHFPGREATVISAMGFNAQHNLQYPAGAGAIAGALVARMTSRRRSTR